MITGKLKEMNDSISKIEGYILEITSPTQQKADECLSGLNMLCGYVSGCADMCIYVIGDTNPTTDYYHNILNECLRMLDRIKQASTQLKEKITMFEKRRLNKEEMNSKAYSDVLDCNGKTSDDPDYLIAYGFWSNSDFITKREGKLWISIE